MSVISQYMDNEAWPHWDVGLETATEISPNLRHSLHQPVLMRWRGPRNVGWFNMTALQLDLHMTFKTLTSATTFSQSS